MGMGMGPKREHEQEDCHLSMPSVGASTWAVYTYYA